MNEDLLLWRWSTSVQVTSLVMITFFFCLLGRNIRTAALRWWVRAWVFNLAALAITSMFWFAQPPMWVMHVVVAPIYMGAKTTFVLFLIQGAWVMLRPGRPLIAPRRLYAGLAAYALAASLVPSANMIGVVQHTAMGTFLIPAGAFLLVRFDVARIWLAIGFLIRGTLGFAEAGAYALSPAGPGSVAPGLARAAAGASSAPPPFATHPERR